MTAEQIAQAGAPIPLDQVLLAQQGSGLGLCIAQRLTELHNGTFAIEGQAGHGTKVTVRLSKPSAH
jgi:two-component system sensor kinase